MTSDQQSNEQPAATVPPADTPPASAAGGSRLHRFKNWYGRHKLWAIPLTIVVILLILAAIPWTRYKAAGLAVNHNLSFEVMDATANTPVSGATVSIGSVSAETDAAGKAILNGISAGKHQLIISKKYYQNRQISILAPIFSPKSTDSFALTATGRQVKITVSNLINKNKLGGVDISVAGVTAKTDDNGSAVVVLPAGVSQQKASLSLNGFNDASVTVQVSSDKIAENDFSLTPAGKIYFLSDLSGKIDVVKTNLDGTDRQTVLAGTGNEDESNTVLLASRDWKYLALVSRRAGGSPTLYMINTTNSDSLSTVDKGDADFTLYGWVNGDLIYSRNDNSLNSWQSGQTVLKSYDASTGKTAVLDQTTAFGSDDNNSVTQELGGVYLNDGQVYYSMNWQAADPTTDPLANKSATFNVVQPDGTGKKSLRSFTEAEGAAGYAISLSQIPTSPGNVELNFYDGTQDSFYTFAGGQVKADNEMTPDKFSQLAFNEYLLSPSGNQMFWSESRDGKFTLFTGDQNGQNSQQIATLSDYGAFGWYTDKYLLVSKGGSELGIMSVAGGSPVKISDYDNNSVSAYGDNSDYGYM